MPKYLLLIHEDESAFAAAGQASFDEVMAAHMAFATELDELGGKSLGGEALQPLATATFLRGTRTAGVAVVDNPAPDVKETLGGYYLVEADGRRAGPAHRRALPGAVSATSRSARSGTSPRDDLT